MKRSYWLYTVLRNGKYQTLVDAYSNPTMFLIIEKEIGNETFLINQLEISKKDYEEWIRNK